MRHKIKKVWKGGTHSVSLWKGDKLLYGIGWYYHKRLTGFSFHPFCDYGDRTAFIQIDVSVYK